MTTRYKLKSNQGFTLIELMLTMIIISILAAYAYPRFSGTSGYSEFTYQARLLAAMRNMQQRAMQDTRSGYCFRMILDTTNSDFGPPSFATQSSTCGTSVYHDENPAHKNPDYLRTGKTGSDYEMAKEGVTLTAVSGASNITLIGFDSLGRPINSAGNPACAAGCTITLTGRDSDEAKVCVEREGYIHGC